VSGLFVRQLLGFGLAPTQVVYLSNSLVFLILLSGVLLAAPRYLAASRATLLGAAAIGLCGSGIGFVGYAYAVQLTSLALATLLLYTAPAWVTLLAWRFLGERAGAARVLAVVAAFVGCGLMARAYDPQALQGSALGLLLGLLGGIGFALYNIISKRLVADAHPLTVSVYSHGAGAALLLPLQGALLPTGLSAAAWPWLAAFAGVGVFIPLLFYLGLRSLAVGVAILVGMWELIVALALAVLVVGESMDPPQAVGALLVIGSVVTLRPDTPIEPLAMELSPPDDPPGEG
jgi:drug/metabolite transporter (DMT)-like permease